MWERGKPSVCGHQNGSVCKYSLLNIRLCVCMFYVRYIIYIHKYISELRVYLLLWQILLLWKDLISVSLSWICFCLCFCCCSLLLHCSSLQCCSSVAVAQSISIPGRWVLSSLSPHPSLSCSELQVTQQTHKDKGILLRSNSIPPENSLFFLSTIAILC